MEASEQNVFLLTDDAGNAYAVPPEAIEEYKLSAEELEQLKSEAGGGEGEGDDEVAGFGNVRSHGTAPLTDWGASLFQPITTRPVRTLPPRSAAPRGPGLGMGGGGGGAL